MKDLTKDEIQLIVDAIDFHIEGCVVTQKESFNYIKRAVTLKNYLLDKTTRFVSVIANINIEIKTPFDNDEDAREYAQNYELPKEYVEDSFEIVKTINTEE